MDLPKEHSQGRQMIIDSEKKKGKGG